MLALAATLGLKATAMRSLPPPDRSSLAGDIEVLLAASGHRTRRIVRPFGAMVLGIGGGCRLLVMEMGASEAFDEAFDLYARQVGPVRYVWQGRIGGRPPMVMALAWLHSGRELRRIGFEVDRRPLLAVAASELCDLTRIEWGQIASVPARTVREGAD